jgi:hypothetical protein
LLKNSPQDLVRALDRAAHAGDEKEFLAGLTRGTRKAIGTALTSRSKLELAERDFYTALDERFGHATTVGEGVGPNKGHAALSRIQAIDLLSVAQSAPNQALLTLKTTTRTSNQQSADQTDTLPARRELGRWKLDLIPVLQGVLSQNSQRGEVCNRAARLLRAGELKDRTAALVAVIQDGP